MKSNLEFIFALLGTLALLEKVRQKDCKAPKKYINFQNLLATNFYLFL